jgi:hypothetical protein
MDLKETGCELDSGGSEQFQIAGTFTHDNGPSDSIQGEDYLDNLLDCQLLNNDSALWS